MVTYANGDVILKYKPAGFYLRLPYRMWVRETQSAIRIREAAKTPKAVTTHEIMALYLLRANGLTSAEKIKAFQERVAALENGPDPSKIVRCVRCTRILSDPVSKALGIGPECRKK